MSYLKKKEKRNKDPNTSERNTKQTNKHQTNKQTKKTPKTNRCTKTNIHKQAKNKEKRPIIRYIKTAS